MSHPLVVQLRFTRSEFLRGVRGVDDADARRRLEPMNCLAWNIGHLAWQEQRYFIRFGQGRVIRPDVDREFANGAPGTTPVLADVLAAWREIVDAADPWLDGLTSAGLREHVMSRGRPTARVHGNLLQRVIYHYWYHTGENQAIRQMLGHRRLPQFVGDIDGEAPYMPDGLPAA